MLRFYRPGDKNLFEWAGIIQKDVTKPLFKSNAFSEADLKYLRHFCYPTEEPISGPLSYVFRFRSSKDVFYNVFCLLDQTSFQLRDLDTNQQCCICMITQYCHFDVFEDILKVIRSLLLHSVASVEHFLETLSKNPQSISTISSLNALIYNPITRDAHIKEMTHMALSLIPVSKLGRLIIALLTDTPVVIISSDLSKFSKFCYSFTSLIHPLEWHHLFLPILPSSYLESIQTPAPFIVGLHKLQLEKAMSGDVEGHVMIDIDSSEVSFIGLEPVPAWTGQLASNFKTGSHAEIKTFIVQLLCHALGVHTANSHRTTIKRINYALETVTADARSFIGTMIHSRTMQNLLDAIKAPNVPVEYARLLAMGNTSAVTSLAVQEIAEFPLKKVAFGRSASLQFPTPAPHVKASQSMPHMSKTIENSE